MVIKLSKLANPINSLIKLVSASNTPLDEKFSKDAYSDAAPTAKLALIRELEKLETDKREVSDLWENRLFLISCIQGAVMVGIVVIGYNNQELSQVLKEKRVIVIGPCMKISIGLLPLIEITRLNIKFISTYHKKQLTDVQSRLRAYTRIDQIARLEELTDRV
ncbi:MAG: hypothetical protein H7A41_01855 [Chlamydiales bacterium]|nr:hypothetical protein [Chlamydiia bacterium]MCP5503876.1 hypothetical protein [Chlamydiales bacterium]